MTDWYATGLKDLETLRDTIYIHNLNNTRLSDEGMVALEMMLNVILKEVRSQRPLKPKAGRILHFLRRFGIVTDLYDYGMN